MDNTSPETVPSDPKFDLEPRQDPPPILPQESAGSKAWKFGSIGLLLLLALGKLKFLLPLLNILKLSKVLTTGGTMFLSMWLYSARFGWSFAAGLVVLILIHEMGHVFVGWRQGLPISAPVFIPFMGAVIFQKRESASAWAQAIMGIGGPIAGAIGAVGCHVIFALTGDPFFLGLAYVGYFINLFNLMPLLPLDGGWIVGAISPWLWLVGLVGYIALFVSGVFRNPLVILLVLLSFPRLWQGLKSKGAPPGGVPATPSQRLTMGAYYLIISGLLLWGMMSAFEHPEALRS